MDRARRQRHWPRSRLLHCVRANGDWFKACLGAEHTRNDGDRSANHHDGQPSRFFDFNDTADLIPPRHDKDEIRSRLLDQLESVLLYLFPRGKRRGSQFYIGNLQGEPGDSLVVELEGPKRGVWIDFATGESGDLLALWASTRGYCLPNDFSELLEDGRRLADDAAYRHCASAAHQPCL